MTKDFAEMLRRYQPGSLDALPLAQQRLPSQSDRQWRGYLLIQARGHNTSQGQDVLMVEDQLRGYHAGPLFVPEPKPTRQQRVAPLPAMPS